MSVEPSSYGVSNWPLPSPSATPKSSGGHQHPFNTPKAESPTFFVDAYYTPSLKGQTTPVLTPTSATTATFRRSIKNSPLSPDDPQFHQNITTTSKLPLPPVDPSKRLSSSPNLLDSPADFSKAVRPLTRTDEMNPYQLQTPPSGEDTRNHRGLAHPSANTSMSFHQTQDPLSTPSRQPPLNFPGNEFPTPTFQTPFQQPLPISTDFHQFRQFQNAPASAPPVPHGRFMWDNSPQMEQFENQMLQTSQPQFAGNNTMMDEMRNWQHQEVPQQAVHSNFIHQQSPTPVQDGQILEAFSYMTDNGGHAHSTLTARARPSWDPAVPPNVNPNLLFSFSSPVQTVNPSSVGAPIPPPIFDPGSRQPYEQQTRESTRERELVKKTRQQKQQQQQQQQHSRTGSSLGPSNRPALQRSNTDSGFRRLKTKSFDARQAVQTAESIQRKSSPLKRLSQASLSSIPESSSRPSRLRTRLIIDDTGTARTETSLDDDDELPSRRTSTHWPGEEDSSEDDPLITSQRNSFVFSSDLLRAPKHARMDSDDEDGGLYKRPLSSTSLSSLTSRMNATPLGRKVSMEAHRRSSQESFSSSLADQLAGSSQDTIMAPDGDDSDTGDAQSALKKLVGGRVRRDFLDPNATIKPRRAATNPVRSSGFMDITKFPSPPSPSLPYGQATSSNNTPTTDRSNRSTDSIRCSCGATDDSSQSPVIRCHRCSNFVHIRCVFGKRAEERNLKLPPIYVCAFCTGHLRMPSFYGDDEVFGASPLGYKSGSFVG
ncbi:hypothetical protein BT63DRAFT_460803 [Microthyrium microscopicum]|uniref:Zinc finger PHD-type domain-containing protein n=1 Tax=Microthyrium microscopicum TaxID=703497 RepID=A0A6A6TW38_9PEZI|nr:hypothetical protein BT63DRAFT_460803 [Microthyrium microscopicum]